MERWKLKRYVVRFLQRVLQYKFLIHCIILSWYIYTCQVPIFAAYLYDAVHLYARSLREVLDEGGNARDGMAIVSKLVRRLYQSKTTKLLYVCKLKYI